MAHVEGPALIWKGAVGLENVTPALAATKAGLSYQLGFANEFATEALPGALPEGQNSPQRPAYGLVSELVSGTAFSAPRALNRRSYLFRIRPSTIAGAFQAREHPNFLTPPLTPDPYPGALRWGPASLASASGDFFDGLFTFCANGSPRAQQGMAFHLYRAGRSMEQRVFSNADAEMLILPQEGAICLVTEAGIIDLAPGEVGIVPRGMKLRVDLPGGPARGFVCENFGLPFVLPDLGLIGSHGLANAVDFQVPVAAYEESDSPVELIHKLCGTFWTAELDHSPFDVVAWRGNWAPVKYDMMRFMVMGTVGVDHPDPSIYCALTSPSHQVTGGNVDFMIIPPRWLVAEHTFRPPGYHRNSLAEILGLIEGSNESRAGGFPPGSISLHNPWTAHGPDVDTLEGARVAPLAPQKIEEALIFMLETRYPLDVAAQAMDADFRIANCEKAWGGFTKRFPDKA
ncbi:MAG: homogentisate 1,2-dioxygenase [Rhizorhabdus sp.]|nr:homogentisate 1,2-dioxygenase [Rhizorhabdus sp.]